MSGVERGSARASYKSLSEPLALDLDLGHGNLEYLNATRAPMPLSPMFGQRAHSLAIRQDSYQFPVRVDFSPAPTDALASLVPKVMESCPIPVYTPIEHLQP